MVPFLIRLGERSEAAEWHTSCSSAEIVQPSAIAGHLDKALTHADMIFIAGSAILAVSTALNAISLHATCTAVFVAVSAVLGFMLMSIKTLQEVSWLSWVGAVSILAALLMMVVVVPLQDRPAAAPQTGPWDKDLKIFNNPSVADALSGVSTVVFSTAAIPAFFSIAAEMKNPHAYTRCMLISEGIATSFLVLVGTVSGNRPTFQRSC